MGPERTAKGLDLCSNKEIHKVNSIRSKIITLKKIGLDYKYLSLIA